MTPESQPSSVPTTPDPLPPTLDAKLKTQDSPDLDERGKGKVARLPKVLRDQVNSLLDDGFTYKAIIQKLNQSTNPRLPYALSEMNISRYKDNSYQDYLAHQDWRADIRSLRESG